MAACQGGAGQCQAGEKEGGIPFQTDGSQEGKNAEKKCNNLACVPDITIRRKKQVNGPKCKENGKDSTLIGI